MWSLHSLDLLVIDAVTVGGLYWEDVEVYNNVCSSV